MAFLLSFERKHRVLRATAIGVVTTQDLEDLDRASIALLSREETDGPPIRGLYDFTEITAMAVSQMQAAARGGRAAIVRGQRVMVQSRSVSCGLVGNFVQGQALTGDTLIAFVDSLDEAHALLGLDAPNFESIE